jgi:hypothetical protein
VSSKSPKPANAERRLAALRIELPLPPTPIGAYVESVQTGNMLYFSGILLVIGHEPKFVGRLAKRYTPTSAAADFEAALRLLEGRWKLVILFHLFGGKVLRFSDLEKAIPAVTQKCSGSSSGVWRQMGLSCELRIPRYRRRLSTGSQSGGSPCVRLSMQF